MTNIITKTITADSSYHLSQLKFDDLPYEKQDHLITGWVAVQKLTGREQFNLKLNQQMAREKQDQVESIIHQIEAIMEPLCRGFQIVYHPQLSENHLRSTQAL